MTRGEERLRTHSAVLQSVLGQLVSSSLQTGVPRTGHVSSRILLSVPILRLFSLLLLSPHISSLTFFFLFFFFFFFSFTSFRFFLFFVFFFFWAVFLRANRLCRCSFSTVVFCVY